MQTQLMDDLTVVKRSGQRVEFNSLKIAVAIKNAFDSMPTCYDQKEINKIYEGVLKYIVDNYQNRKTINVEEIQDIIELILKDYNYKEIAESYSCYRSKRTISRNVFEKKQQHKFVKAIEKIGTINIEQEKPSASLRKFGQIISNEYTKSYVMDNKYVRAVEEGKIYVHNFAYFHLGYLPFVNLDINKLAFYENCFYDITNLLLEAKKEVRGEILVDSFDKVLSKYILNNFKKIFKDYLYKYLKVTNFIDLFNFKKLEDKIMREKTIDVDLNNYYDMFCNDYLVSVLEKAYDDALENVVDSLNINIKKLFAVLNEGSKYTISLGSDLSKEGSMIQNIILNEIDAMDCLDNVCIIYKINKNTQKNFIDKLVLLIENNKNIRLNFLADDTLCDCEYFKDGYRIYENIYSEPISTGRMNVANTSINLARLGIKHRALSKEFYEELDSLVEFTKNELLFVFENLGDRSKNNYKFIFDDNIYDDEKLDYGQKIRKVIKNGTLNINLIGIKECACAIDKNNYLNVVLEILNFLSVKIREFTSENRLNFTLSSVQEASAKEFVDFDKAIYGLIRGITEKNQYENFAVINNVDDFSELNRCVELLNGGNLLEVCLNKNVSSKKIFEIIDVLRNKYNGLVMFKIGSDKS